MRLIGTSFRQPSSPRVVSISYLNATPLISLFHLAQSLLIWFHQLLTMAPTGSRTKTGCFTCRIRKKKCDEEKPFCLNCRSREIVCHAYDAKPAWMYGMRSWRIEVMQSKEASLIREAAETSYKLRRRSIRTPNVQNKGQRVTRAPNPSKVATTAHAFMGIPEMTPNNRNCLSSLEVNQGFDNTLAIAEFQPSLSLARSIGYIISPHIALPEEVDLLHSYLNIIFPLQYASLTNTSSCSRQWLFENLLHSPAFYSASASIASSFIALQTTPPPLLHRKKPSLPPQVFTLQSKALVGLRCHISTISTHESLAAMSKSELLKSGMQILGIIAQLISFQVINFTSGGWGVHLSAARRILGLFQNQFLPDYFRPFPTVAVSSDSEHKSQDVEGMDFFVGTFVWVDIIAGATFGPYQARLERREGFEYLDLLKMGRWELKNIMGCQTSVMIAIAEVTELERWTVGQAELDVKKLAAKVLAIENGLRRAIAVLQSSTSASTWGLARDDTKEISLIFAHAALIYLQTVASGPCPQTADTEENVERCLKYIEALPASLLIRICWPFTVAGSMATEVLYARFRAVLGRMGGQGDVSMTKAASIMEECWRWRAVEKGSGEGIGSWRWRNAMERLGVRILLT
ncbi:fungal-specific transcription factor domain-containing protein [Calycina marina]|uniref:Fungal-specific transcription factor domain-containing protein n=1 Tax=Calycina marina TaxID=1763456 RepID=A0A9P8CAL8_9HELO|nr:fungal-specific transcription factor domain-containing protein [Calycina marina]